MQNKFNSKENIVRQSKISVCPAIKVPPPAPPKPTFEDLPVGAFFYWKDSNNFIEAEQKLIHKKLDHAAYVNLEDNYYERCTCQYHWEVVQVDVEMSYSEV
jgi:hypothetical protein